MKIALLVIYNHNYTKNIDRIDNLYKGKFTHVYHLIPFYSGSLDNVIPVYENSYYFQNYIAQAYQKIKDKGFTHYFVVADDMIINPRISQSNVMDILGIPEGYSFISDFIILQELKKPWAHALDAAKYRTSLPGVEIENILPSSDNAKLRFTKYGLSIAPIPRKVYWSSVMLGKGNKIGLFYSYGLYKLRDVSLNYPLVGAYSDILFLDSSIMDNFRLYCGAFAATNLFVELAIPTALVLSSDKIVTENDLKLKGIALWGDDIASFEKKHDFNLNKLIDSFPNTNLYVHPIKLSRWK